MAKWWLDDASVMLKWLLMMVKLVHHGGGPAPTSLWPPVFHLGSLVTMVVPAVQFAIGYGKPCDTAWGDHGELDPGSPECRGAVDDDEDADEENQSQTRRMYVKWYVM